MLTRDQVMNKKFRETRLSAGYDQDEVDGFLDECAETIGNLYRQIDELATRLEVSEKQTAAGSQLAGIEKLLAVAQQTADQTVAEAEHAAATRLVEADEKANGIIGSAYSRADQVAAEAMARARAASDRAQKEASDIVAEAVSKRDKVNSQCEELTESRNALVTLLQNALEAVHDSRDILAIEPSEASTVLLPALTSEGTDE